MAATNGSEVPKSPRNPDDDHFHADWATVYDELRKVAAQVLRHQPGPHTMQPTALVHEAFMRLLGKEQRYSKNRYEFFTAASRAMRRILIDRSRRRHAAKRGGNMRRIPLSRMIDLEQPDDDVLLALDDALIELEAIYPDLARIVELRFFGGFTLEEIAELTEVSAITIRRRWQLARGWLHRELIRND